MNMIYDQFIHSSLDLSALGLDDITAINQDRVAPGNARVLAWLTDSSVCFCQFPEQADTVYASDCSALPEEQLLPVAKNILDFIKVHFGEAKVTCAGHNVSFDISFVKQMFKNNKRSFENYFSHRLIDTSSILSFLYFLFKEIFFCAIYFKSCHFSLIINPHFFNTSLNSTIFEIG